MAGFHRTPGIKMSLMLWCMVCMGNPNSSGDVKLIADAESSVPIRKIGKVQSLQCQSNDEICRKLVTLFVPRHTITKKKTVQRGEFVSVRLCHNHVCRRKKKSDWEQVRLHRKRLTQRASSHPTRSKAVQSLDALLTSILQACCASVLRNSLPTRRHCKRLSKMRRLLVK